MTLRFTSLTACRSIHLCDSCHETFEQFKPL
ncbi:hypothetical protein [Fulvivirga aurantia]